MGLMSPRTGSQMAALLLAIVGSGWWTAAAGAMPEAPPHRATATERGPAPAAHRHESSKGDLGHPYETSLSTRRPHECPHCPAQHCSTAYHCSAASPPASAAGGPVLEFPTSIAPPPLWLSDRLLSANPTPPIPPPQLVL